MTGDGSRSRKGCFACRKRKRRCPEGKPSCESCLKSGTECIYPASQSSVPAYNFVVASSPGHHIVPLREYGQVSFLNLHSNDIEKICSEYHTPAGTSESSQRMPEENLDVVPATLGRTLSPIGVRQMGSVESSLIQYYAEIITSSRVYVPTERNMFKTTVMPVVLCNKGPLLSAVLALSSAEWSRNADVGDNNYGLLSSNCKVQAIQELQQTLNQGQNAEENLLTCLLLTTLEIAEGSKSTWITHSRGALAIADQFHHLITPSTARFAILYFQFRHILLKTTKPAISAISQEPSEEVQNSLDSSDNLDLSPHMMRFTTIEDGTENMVDEHMGCPLELIAIIRQIAELSSVPLGPHFSQEELYQKSNQIEESVTNMIFTVRDSDDWYLLQSAEAFRIATQIYLRLVCFSMANTHQSMLDLHAKLLNILCNVIVHGQYRRSFPMWPLFVAGCTSSTDEQRKAILELYSIVDGQWPISNISTIWSAIRTIWHSRDLLPTSSGLKQRDWQEIIHKFGWKLSLT